MIFMNKYIFYDYENCWYENHYIASFLYIICSILVTLYRIFHNWIGNKNRICIERCRKNINEFGQVIPAISIAFLSLKFRENIQGGCCTKTYFPSNPRDRRLYRRKPLWTDISRCIDMAGTPCKLAELIFQTPVI